MKKLFITILLGISTAALAQQTEHQVKRGETFASIAAKYGITEAALRKANADRKTAFAGMKLRIPAAKTTSEKVTVDTPVPISEPTVQPSAPTTEPTVQPSAPTTEHSGNSFSMVNFNKGKEYFYNKKWKKAIKAFNNVLADPMADEETKQLSSQFLAQAQQQQQERKERREAFWSMLSKGLKAVGNTLVETVDVLQQHENRSNNTYAQNQDEQSGIDGIQSPGYYNVDNNTSSDPRIGSLEQQLRDLKYQYAKLERECENIELNSKQEIERRMQRIRDIKKRKVGRTYELTSEEKNLLELNKQTRSNAQKKKEQILRQMTPLNINIQRLENQISALKGGNVNNSAANTSPSPQSSQRREKRYRTCTSCGGTGLVPDMRHDRTISTVGSGNTYHLCDQCGKRHHGTAHKSCSSCRGTGQKEIR